jgi:hypothetical protein
MIGYELHPEAVDGVDEIAAYIGQDSPEAVMHGHRSPRVMAAILRGRKGHEEKRS